MLRSSLLLKFSLLTLALFTFASGAQADRLKLMRRWVVFPFEAESPLRMNADNAWWKVREKITEKKRFLVASKQFLVQKDVFQPRKSLSKDDVGVLAQLLDADILVTGYNEQRNFTLNAYLAQDGHLLWTKTVAFHPSLKPEDQIEAVSQKLIQDFLEAVPYHAFTIVDPLVGKSVFEEANKKYAIIDLGAGDDVKIGNDVQWVEINLPDTVKGTKTVLGESKLSVIAEGRVAKIKRGVAVVEVLTAKSIDSINEKSLVRFPHLLEKKADYGISENKVDSESPQVVNSVITPVTPDSTSSKRTTAIITSVASILGILILAF